MGAEATLLETSKIAGTAVYGVDNVQIGELDELLIDTINGQVRYAVISFGGLLGLGRSHYVVPWLTLKWQSDLQGYVTGITQAQLEASPNNPSSWGDRSWEEKLHGTFGAPGYWEPQLLGVT